MNTDPIYGPVYLPEVTINAKKENPLLIPYRNFNKKFEAEVDWNNLSAIERILSLLSVPQAFVTYHATKGKETLPSKALGINNPVGSFITDMVLDIPFSKVNKASEVLSLSSQEQAIRRGTEYLKHLKEVLYKDLLKKFSNIDSRLYDKERLLELFKRYSEITDIPKLMYDPEIKSPTVWADFLNDLPSKYIRDAELPIISSRIHVPEVDLTSSHRLADTLIHEIGHLYDKFPLFTKKARPGLFSDDLYNWLPVDGTLSKSFFDERFIGNVLANSKYPESKKLKIYNKYFDKKLLNFNYLVDNPSETYPYLLQTFSRLQQLSPAPLEALSRRSFRRLVEDAPKSSFYSSDPYGADRLFRMFEASKLADPLYGILHQYPVITTTKKP